MATKYEFAIKKDVRNSGKEVYTPVCRKKSRFGRLFPNPWARIVQIYDNYVLMELDFETNLTYSECKNHIECYQETLRTKIEDETATMEFHDLEVQEI